MLSPWKKKKSAKPQTTEVQMMQSRGMSLIRSPLRSWGGGGGGGGETAEGQASTKAAAQPFLDPAPLPSRGLLALQTSSFRKPASTQLLLIEPKPVPTLVSSPDTTLPGPPGPRTLVPTKGSGWGSPPHRVLWGGSLRRPKPIMGFDSPLV